MPSKARSLVPVKCCRRHLILFATCLHGLLLSIALCALSKPRTDAFVQHLRCGLPFDLQAFPSAKIPSTLGTEFSNFPGVHVSPCQSMSVQLCIWGGCKWVGPSNSIHLYQMHEYGLYLPSLQRGLTAQFDGGGGGGAAAAFSDLPQRNYCKAELYIITLRPWKLEEEANVPGIALTCKQVVQALGLNPRSPHIQHHVITQRLRLEGNFDFKKVAKRTPGVQQEALAVCGQYCSDAHAVTMNKETLWL
eukprot:1153196-Pelagomonas_calceolata.AAC.1